MKHQDYIYEKENYYNNPKEYFVFLKELIKKSFLKRVFPLTHPPFQKPIKTHF